MSLQLEDTYRRADLVLEKQLDEAEEHLCSVYFERLGVEPYPSDAKLIAARSAAERRGRDWLLSAEVTRSILEPGDDLKGRERAALELSLNKLLPRMPEIHPQSIEEISPVRLGLAALLGAILGALVCTPIFRFCLDDPKLGLILGPPLGALLIVLAVWYSAHSTTLRTLLTVALGFATFAELLSTVWQVSWFGRIWNRLTRNKESSWWKRCLVYLGLVILLASTRLRSWYDRCQYEKIVRETQRLWLRSSLRTLISLLRELRRRTTDAPSAGQLVRLVNTAQKLHSCSMKSLPSMAQAVLDELRTMGVCLPEGEPSFLTNEEAHHKSLVWGNGLEDRYDTFGEIEPGERVLIEDEPVIISGTVRRRGLVRKYRGGE